MWFWSEVPEECVCFPEECMCVFHTKGQLKASIQQHLVWGRVGGAADLTFSHQNLRVQ